MGMSSLSRRRCNDEDEDMMFCRENSMNSESCDTIGDKTAAIGANAWSWWHRNIGSSVFVHFARCEKTIVFFSFEFSI